MTDSVCGTGRNEFLTKTTWWLLVIFLVSSLVLAKTKTREHNDNELKINTPGAVEAVEAPVKKTPEIKPLEDKPVDDKTPVAPPATTETPKAP